MDRIIEGVKCFRQQEYAQNKKVYEELACKQQRPQALFITCSDSRVVPHRITSTQPGDLFEIRNAGNIVPPHGKGSGGEAATIEYSLEVLEVKNIIVCGHSQCGALKAMLEEQPLMQLPAARDWLGHSEATRRIVSRKYPNVAFEELWVLATQENVLVQMNHLSTHPSVAARLASGDVHVYAWYYDIGSGCVLQFDQTQGRFVELGGDAVSATPLPTMWYGHGDGNGHNKGNGNSNGGKTAQASSASAATS
jgi:carbonic anhydrase